MTYQQWLDTLVLPIQYFLQWLLSIADSLIHNYIFITLLGISIFISLFWFLYNIIVSYIHPNKFDIDNLLDKKINNINKE